MSAVEKALINRFLIPFAVAICAVAGGGLLRLFVTGEFGPGLPPFITFYPAVMLAAVWGGFLAGLLATTISALIAIYWLIPPIGEFTISNRLVTIGIIIFLTMGVFMSGLAELYRRNRRKAAAYDRETAVRESQARLAMFAEATFEGIVGIEAGWIVDCNEQFARMLGYSVAELKGLEIASLIASADRDRVMSSIQEHRNSAIDLAMIRKDGTRVIAEAHSRSFSHVSSRSHLALRDLSERRHVEEALRQSETRLRRFYESGLLGVIYWNMSGEITDANDKFLKVVGYDREDLKAGRIDWVSITPPEYRHLDEQSVTELKATGVNKEPFEKEFLRKDGTRIPVIIAGAMLDEARFNGVAFVLDITERKKMEDALRQREHRYRSFVEVTMTNQWAWVTDAGGLVVEDIPALRSFTGQTYEQAKGAGWTTSLHPDDVQRTLEVWMRAVATKALYETEYRMRRHDGVYRNLLARGVPVLDEQGNVLEWVGTCIDITERKQAEEALRKAKDELEERVQERTEELAQSRERLQHLASQLLLAQENERKRVAVELHDGLMSELAATKFLLESKIMHLDNGKQIDPAELRRVADILAGTMKEARRLMNNLRPSVLDELGLIATIGWLCGEYQKSYPHIKVETKIGVMEGDISESIRVVIFRVLQEALNNFAKHGKGDRVEVSLSKSDGVFEFMIRDNGQGFDVENAEKGLGLESMRERVELLGGRFQIESIIGQGTTIRAIWSRS